MAVYKRKKLKYDIFNPGQMSGIYPAPIVSDTVSPGTTDHADIGTIWVNKSTNDAFILTDITANVASWQDISGISAGATDGQVWIGATGAAGGWANITSTGLSVTVTNTANGINLEAAGVAALTTLDGDAGTATPLAGVIIIAGGTNITTAGAVGTLTVNLDASPSVAGSLTAGTTITAGTAITAGVDLTMSTGDLTVTADTDAAQTIYLHANGGVSETIELHSDLGTGTDSIHAYSDVGGITLDSGLAGANSIIIDASDAAGGIDVDAGTGGINVAALNGAVAITSGTGAINVGIDAAAHTVTVGSVNTTAATVIQSGTGDVAITSTDAITADAVGVLELNSSGAAIGIGSDADAFGINVGTGAAARTITVGNVTGATAVVVDCGTGDLSLGASATAHATTLGGTNTTSNVIVQSGTGGIQVTSGGVYAMDATDAVTIESSAGTIGIGVDAVAQNMNIGTGAAARVITIGNVTGVTGIALNAGTGDIVAASQDAVTIDAVGVLELNSSGADIAIGNDAAAFDINIGTGGAEKIVTIGNATDASSVVIEAGTGAVSIGANAIAHTTTVGSVTVAADTTIQAGTGALTIDGLGIIDIDAAGALSINSDGGVINIGNDADAQNMNIGTGAAARVIQIGNATGVTEVEITGGSAGITLTPTLGIMTAAPLEVSVAGVAITASANLASCTFTGQTTAAAAEQEFTITNTLCTITSMLFVTATNVSAADCQMYVTRVEPKAGSFVVTLTNHGAASLDSNVIINFWLFKAS